MAANYQFTQTGDEIQAILDKAQSPDSAPTAGSQGLVTSGGVKTALDEKVDKVSGKGLSTNDFSNAEKSKLAGVAAGAQVNVLEGVQVNGSNLPISGKKVNVTIPAPIDNLTSTSTTSPLSANQGKVLDGKVAALGQKVEDELGKYEENPEYIKVIVDADGKILEGIRIDGAKEYRIPVKALADLIANKIQSGEISADSLFVNENEFNAQDNPEFVKAVTDKDGKILYGVKTNGEFYFGKGVPISVQRYVLNQIGNIDLKDPPLRKWLGYIKAFDFVSANAVLFTIADVTIGQTYQVSFKLAGTVGAVGLFNSSDERISYVGIGSTVTPGTAFSAPMTIPSGFSYAKAIWGDGLNDFSLFEYFDPATLNDTLKLLAGGVKSYFADEMEETIETILGHTFSPSVVLPILTDSHWGESARAEEQTFETIENVKYLCNNCFCDAVVHLGDLLQSSWNATLLSQGYSQDEANTITTRMMSEYLNQYAAANPLNHLYAVGGNHDGTQLQNFKYQRWYGIIGRKENEDATIVKDGLAPYFYVDYPKCNLRCVFLQQPNDYENNGLTTFGYTEDMLDWLVSDALDVEDGMHVVMFSHIAPFQASYITDGVLENRSSFYGVCNAFYNHSTFSDSVVSCDFSALQTSKLLCYVCGHTHGDWIYEPGETFEGTAYVGGETIPWTYTNGLPCPCVIITNTFFGNNGDGETRNGDAGTVHVPRVDQSVTQDAWDIFVYNPSEKKIIFVRFGSGEDRIVDLSSVI